MTIGLQVEQLAGLVALTETSLLYRIPLNVLSRGLTFHKESIVTSFSQDTWGSTFGTFFKEQLGNMNVGATKGPVL